MTVSPRRFGLALKLTALAFFARLGGCNSNFNRGSGGAMPHLPAAFHTAMLATMLLVSVVAIAFALGWFYVGARLQFVLFESVLRDETALRPLWRKYGPATWRWIGLKLAVYAAILVCLLPLIAPAALTFYRMFKTPASVFPQHFFPMFFGMFGALFVSILVFGICSALLLDFALPLMALEGTPFGATLERVWWLVKSEPGPVALYMLLRLLLSWAASFACLFGLLLIALVTALPLGGLGAVAWVGCRHGGTGSHVLLGAVLVVLGLLAAAVLCVAFVMLFGFSQLFLQAYALYFLGGRYPLLGQYVERWLPPPVFYAPPAGYPPPSAG